jgi:hypothetical protein
VNGDGIEMAGIWPGARGSASLDQCYQKESQSACEPGCKVVNPTPKPTLIADDSLSGAPVRGREISS